MRNNNSILLWDARATFGPHEGVPGVGWDVWSNVCSETLADYEWWEKELVMDMDHIHHLERGHGNPWGWRHLWNELGIRVSAHEEINRPVKIDATPGRRNNLCTCCDDTNLLTSVHIIFKHKVVLLDEQMRGWCFQRLECLNLAFLSSFVEFSTTVMYSFQYNSIYIERISCSLWASRNYCINTKSLDSTVNR